MKKLICCVTLFCMAISSYAQQVLACQFVAANGFKWQPNSWKPSSFNPPKPFILKLDKDRNIDEKTIANLWFFSSATVCKKTRVYSGEVLGCSEVDLGSSFILNIDTLSGAFSTIFAATLKEGVRKDDMGIFIFECQNI